jgi:putative acetyltransferase
MTATIRVEQTGDESAIHSLHDAAFSSPLEGQLVDDLRRSGRLTISRVAVDGNKIIGHIAFSAVTIGQSSVGLGLAPLAVLPEYQRQSIGSILVLDALGECTAIGAGFVVVLGSPVYYRRFGFKPAASWNLVDEFQGGDAFLALELVPGAIPAGGGLVRYTSEFSNFLPQSSG